MLFAAQLKMGSRCKCEGGVGKLTPFSCQPAPGLASQRVAGDEQGPAGAAARRLLQRLLCRAMDVGGRLKYALQGAGKGSTVRLLDATLPA